MDFKRILVAVNSLNGRDAAFDRALTLARVFGAELYLLHAVAGNQRFSAGADERLARMAQMRERAERAGVSVQTVEQQGDAAEIIELHADARDVDLIVMGSAALRGWGRRSYVAERVIRRTNVPALVVASDAPPTKAEFRKVVVAVDLSPGSIDVLTNALALTSHEARQLTVMHTVKGVEAADAVRSPARWAVPEYRTHVLEDARERLQTILSQAPTNIDTRVAVSTGSAARAILDYAADADADLVVVGRSRGIRMLGSTAQRLLRKSERALLVIPGEPPRTKAVDGHVGEIDVVSRMPHAPEAPVLVLPRRTTLERGAREIRRILVPVDFSIASTAALRTAADLSRRHGARVTVLHALTEVPRQMVFSGSEASEVVRRLPTQLQTVADRLRRTAARFGMSDVDPEVATGDADRAILEIASRGDGSDLIVMGFVRRSWLTRLVLGSTVRRVLRRATVPVLIVPVAAAAATWPDDDSAGRDSSSLRAESPAERVAA